MSPVIPIQPPRSALRLRLVRIRTPAEHRLPLVYIYDLAHCPDSVFIHSLSFILVLVTRFFPLVLSFVFAKRYPTLHH